MNRYKKSLISIVLAVLLCLNLIGPALAENSVVQEVHLLLAKYYVDPPDMQVYEADTVEKTLDRLNDPYTEYFTADEYNKFVKIMDDQFSGVGVYIDSAPEGILILGVIRNSPGETAGLKAGDIILKAGGKSMAGISVEEAKSILRGEEGTLVDLVVKRDGQTFNVPVTRKQMDVPTLEYDLLAGHIGYISIGTFGATTGSEFNTAIKELKKQKADQWIIDLRNNGGGYLETARVIAGYFIGHNTALQVKGRESIAPYNARITNVIINQPVILLINQYSASASEIVAAALKDYDKATIVGTKSFGKGTMQRVFNLSNGDYLKLTVAHFYSPQQHEINKVGVSPDLPVESISALPAAVLMFSGSQTDKVSGDSVRINIHGKSYQVNLDKARTPDYWAAWNQLLQAAETSGAALEMRTGGQGWSKVSAEDIKARWPLYYPGYSYRNIIKMASDQAQFNIYFACPVKTATINNQSLELINVKNGQRTELDFKVINNHQIQAVPKKALEAGQNYWLVAHKSITRITGQPMPGTIYEVTVSK